MLVYSILTTLPLFISLFGAIVLFVSPQRNLAKKFLGYFLLVVSLNYFTHALYFNHEYKLFAFFENIWFFTSLAVFPLYYYYVRLLSKDDKLDKKWLWILSPAVIISLFSFIIYFQMDVFEKEIYIQNLMYHKGTKANHCTQLISLCEIKQLLYRFTFILQIPIYLYFSFILIVKYNKSVKEFYSNIQEKSLCKINWVLVAFLFTSIIAIASSLIGKDFFIDKGMWLIIPSISHSLFLILIIYVGYHQDFTIKDFNKEIESYHTDKNENANIQPYSTQLTKETLTVAMENEKLFTNPDLRITDLASALQTNRTYISRIVNEEFQSNFSDWVNSYRVEYVKQMMHDPDNDSVSLIELSEIAGFPSKSVFYRAFNKALKMPPGKYREKIKHSK